MKALIHGLIAGALSGALISVLFFIDAGPGNLLHTSARWLSLDNPTTGKWIGLLVFLVLGTFFGGLFSLTQRQAPTQLGRSLLFGVLTGVLFWALIPFLLEIVLKNHGSLDLGGFLWTFVPLLIYGVALGSLYSQRTGGRANG